MQIDHNSNIPIYEQLYHQLLKYITTGLLRPDDKLPSVRELSSSLHINPNTVVKAYNLLINDGLIQAINKKGYLVIYSTKNNKDQNLINELDDIKKEGYTKEEIINALEEVYKNDWNN